MLNFINKNVSKCKGMQVIINPLTLYTYLATMSLFSITYKQGFYIMKTRQDALEEISYISHINPAIPPKEFGFSTDSFLSYCEMQLENIQRRGFPDLNLKPIHTAIHQSKVSIKLRVSNK